jgi:hypothetical protein
MRSFTSARVMLVAAGLAAGIMPVVMQTPAATAEPQVPFADPIYCDIGQGMGTNGAPYGGKATGPSAGRQDHQDAVYANYEFRCSEQVTLLVHWSMIGHYTTWVKTGDSTVFVQSTSGCSATTPCVAFLQTPKKQISPAFDCSQWSASGTADVYPSGTLFPSGPPLQSFQILTSTASPC